MSSTAWFLSAGFAVLMLLGVPFAFAIAIVVALSLVVSGIEPMLLSQTFIAGTLIFFPAGVSRFSCWLAS